METCCSSDDRLTMERSNSRKRRRTITRPNHDSFHLPTHPFVAVLCLAIITIPTLQALPIEKVADYSCNAVKDSCPTQFDGRCDALTNPSECGNNDCYDCDQCQQFSADCQGCLSHGCFYCPGDASCFNSPNYIQTLLFSHCTQASDYLTETCEEPDNFYSDPAYSGEAWVYDMIYVEKVWEQGYTGKGIRVRVNDNGVDATHPEFQGRFDTDHSCQTYLPQELGTGSESHGTIVAAIIGAAANNGECSVGIAPEVTLSSCYVFDGYTDFFNEQVDSYDISQNSFGVDGCKQRDDDTIELRQRRMERYLQVCPFQVSSTDSPCNVCTDYVNPSADCESSIKRHCDQYYEQDQQSCLEFLDLILGGNCLYDVLPDSDREAIVRGVTKGRNGKGILYVFAAGNSYKNGDDTNIQAYTNSRFVISVGAVGKDKYHASYSTPGASLFLSAPGGDSENFSNHVTAGVGGTCDEAGIGTSFACPVVSGVIALMLEANSELTWRDVQHILARTSQQVLDLEDDTNTENSAGYWHSNLYGFGIVNAAAAVEEAVGWENVGPEKMLMAESGIVNLPIADDETSILKTALTMEASESFLVESVVVQLDLEYIARGHLKIVLTSPQGTESILHPGLRPENTQLDVDDRWKFLTVRNWGENPSGTWTMTIVDLKKGNAGDCVSAAWSMDWANDSIDCNLIEAFTLCKDGVLDPLNQLPSSAYDAIFNHTDDNGLQATEACCPCGGGISDAQVADQLRQWTLLVYGTDTGSPAANEGRDGDDDDDATPTPESVSTAAPMESPTISPTTASPTMQHSAIPDKDLLPTQAPSPEPSPLNSSLPPNFEPTPFQTDSPSNSTDVPSMEPTLNSTSTMFPSATPSSSRPTPTPTKEPISTAAPTRLPTLDRSQPFGDKDSAANRSWTTTTTTFVLLLLFGFLG